MIAEALRILAPKAKWRLEGNDYSNIEWFTPDIQQPTQAQIDVTISELMQQIPLDDCKKKANELIAACDWSVLPDVNISNRADFETYRATLRIYFESCCKSCFSNGTTTGLGVAKRPSGRYTFDNTKQYMMAGFASA